MEQSSTVETKSAKPPRRDRRRVVDFCCLVVVISGFALLVDGEMSAGVSIVAPSLMVVFVLSYLHPVGPSSGRKQMGFRQRARANTMRYFATMPMTSAALGVFLIVQAGFLISYALS